MILVAWKLKTCAYIVFAVSSEKQHLKEKSSKVLMFILSFFTYFECTEHFKAHFQFRSIKVIFCC